MVALLFFFSPPRNEWCNLTQMQPSPKAVDRFLQRPWMVYVFCLIVVAGIVLGLVYRWDQTTKAFDRALQPSGSADAGTQHLSKRFFLDNDSYYWITYAREMAKTGEWRIRYTYVDNVPYGREVHWSQSVSWLLVAFGFLRHCGTSEPMFKAIETASILVNPFLLLLFTSIFSWLIAQRMGVIAAVFFALMFATLPDVLWMFHPFHLGHHGLHLASSLGTLLCLVLGGLGWVAKGQGALAGSGTEDKLVFFRPLQLVNQAAARRYFAAAGVFTGLGLWVGATVQFFSIGALAMGSVMLALFMPARLTGEHADYVPELWRMWGLWASVVGMAFYLVEYFPSHVAMRLEVNSPFHILTVFCIGELMVQLTRWRTSGRPADLFGYLKIAALVGGVVLVPVLVLFGPSQWHNLRDVQMSRLHNLIAEFSTYLNFRPERPLQAWFFDHYGVIPFSLLGAMALAGPRRTRLYEWAGLWISFFLCVFTLLLTLWQVRWSGLHAAMSIWLMIVVGHIAWRNVLSVPAAKRPVSVAVLLMGLVLVQTARFAAREFSYLRNIRQGRTADRDFIEVLMRKHLVEGLRDESRGRPIRVICDPDMAPALYYFGGIPTVTSFYWENAQGLHDATAFFADRGDAAARQIAKERGLTHVIVSRDERWPPKFHYIQTGNTSIADARPTLMARLSPNRRELPSWITLDRDLARIGQREFSLKTPQGITSLRSQMTIYHLEPADSAGRASADVAPESQ